MSGYRVLVAEDETTYARTVGRFLVEHGHEVKICGTGKAAEKALAGSEWDVLLLDLKLPDANGIDILARVRRDFVELQTIIVTGFANVESAIEAMRLGAFDYLTKPPNFDELAVRVERAAEKTLLERENRRLRFQVSRSVGGEILTQSPALNEVLATLAKVAGARTPVLIEGESGVGKELLAQRLHRISPRSGRAFVDLNCAAVPGALLESELFGHEKGAFTGATNEKPGLVEVADGGTLFLDEVGEMPAEIQTKLLRVLDSGTFYRVGATRKRRADFRLVAATNRDLRAEVAAGRFRKDLFYRIHGVRVVVPPLRERPEDVPFLVQHFARAQPVPRAFSAEALAALQRHDWPGNVRELQFAVERAGLLAEGETIGVQDLPPEILEAAGAARPAAASSAADREPFDASRVRAALEKTRWRRAEAAKLLGVSPRTLHRWMKRLALCLGLALASVLSAHAAGPAGPPKVVVLVTIDTLRADHLASYGYLRQTSPLLDRLAARGVLFENAISSASHTAPAHASIFTGLLPQQHRVRVNGQAIQARPDFPITTLAQLLSTAGYDTAAFASVGFLKPITAGFASLDVFPRVEYELYRQAPATVEGALRWLRQKSPGDRFFIWVHLFDPHPPQLAPKALIERFTPRKVSERNDFARRMIVERGVAPTAYPDADALAVAYASYDAEIAFADAALARLFGAMEARRLNKDAVWIVTGDHGEGLGNHNEIGHGPFVYNEQLHVPLIVYAPGRFKPRRVGQLVRHVDLLPSLVELLATGPPPQARALTGRSLLPLLRGGALPPVAAFSERRPSPQGTSAGHWEPGDLYALQDAASKYIVHSRGQDEFFDLASDPLELTNLALVPSKARDAMKSAAERQFLAMSPVASEPRPVDPETLEELKALGYLP